jgi:hypothetical protein
MAECTIHGCGKPATTKRQSSKHLIALCATCAARWDKMNAEAGR